jgi:hypothetical protein
LTKLLLTPDFKTQILWFKFEYNAIQLVQNSIGQIKYLHQFQNSLRVLRDTVEILN